MATDPFADLAAPAPAMEPRPEFARALRRRIEEALFPTIDVPGRTAMTTTEPTTTATAPAAATQRLVPYLCCRGAAEALDFYARALGAVEVSRMVGDDGRVGHSEITVQGARIMLADEYPEIDVYSPTHFGGSAIALNIDVDDCDAVYERALAAGARGLRPPEDQFYGARAATIVDPFGHRWTLNTQREQIDSEEMSRRAATEGYALVESATTSRDPDAGPVDPAVPGTAASGAPVEVGYLTMATTDTARARQFFGDLFGWRFEAGASGEGYAHIANTQLPMGLTPDGVGEAPALYFRVGSIAEMSSRVVALGGTVVSSEQYESGGSATCRDDQGMSFLLWEPAPGY